MRVSIFLLLIFSAVVSEAQSTKQQLHVGLNLVVPDHEPLFRENFDGRPGAQIFYRKVYPKKISIGLGAETYSVRAITDNKNSFNVTHAAFYSGLASFGYNIISSTKTFVAPYVETGFSYINYDKSEPSNFTGRLGAGIKMQYFMESVYGLELGLSYISLMTPFSPESFPLNNTNMRFIVARLGFTFNLPGKNQINTSASPLRAGTTSISSPVKQYSTSLSIPNS